MKRAPAKLAAAFIEPMKALGLDGIPEAPVGTWHGEIKYDGYRAIAVLNAGKVELWSRNHKPLDYPELMPALAKIRCKSAVLDGEIVAFDGLGRSNFQVLQGRDLGERPPIVFYLFDLLERDGRSLLDEPIEARRAALESLVKRLRRPLRLSPVFDVAPAALFAETKKHGLEGVILKRAGSVYESGRRSGAWSKVKHRNAQEFVIGGFTPPQNSRQHFGAILVGFYEGRNLLYAGKVGTGFDAALLGRLHTTFLGLTSPDCPFSNLPLDNRSRFGQGMTRSVMKTVTWLKPKLVAQIKFAEWTQDGRLRQPVFLGLRKDKPAKAVVREKAAF